ncbi:MAG: hypothetical protein JO115_00720 [Pseudonocardiales bacterium]|nr:hypothetical protein [Pseudonocardiales bacterium]
MRRNLRQIVEICASLLMMVVVGCAAPAPTARAPQPPAAPGVLTPNPNLGVGGADATVAPENQQRLASDACAAGSTVELHIYPGLDHSPTVNASLVDSIPFARKAFAGQPITGNCHR